MNTTPLYIFDLDGTLADLKHRRHHVTRPARECSVCAGLPRVCPACNAAWKPNWDAFHAACVDDTPIKPVTKVLEAVALAGADIWIYSGRSDVVMEETRDWLKQHCPLWRRLKMRDHGDYTPDDQLKESWLHAMSPEDRARLVMVFDDRQRVVDMWRRNGVVCAQVAPEDF